MLVQRDTIKAARQTLQERGNKATQALRESLRLPTNLSDAELLRTAMAEAVVRETAQNPRLANDIQRTYEELASLRVPTRKRTLVKAEALPPLIPIRRDLPDRPFDPYAPPDPQFLLTAYGSQQLARALQGYSVDMLKLAATKLEASHPGTKPTNRGQRKSLIAYIVEQSPKA